MAQAAWPSVFKQVCGTPDFDTIKAGLGEAHRGIAEIQRQIQIVSFSLAAGRKAIDGVVEHVGGLAERLCVLEHKVDDFVAGAADLDASVCRVREVVATQETLIRSARQEMEKEIQAVASRVSAIQSGLDGAQKGIATFDGRLCAVEAGLEVLRGRTLGPKGSPGPAKGAS